ncbi:histidine--tRNA ligase [Candidatus Beckwithbacteria bacterium CG22_combo_CG10-13_8_21_14_all_01_47_9]|uniref:Histidine--tRNA ligase n=3 Tax=Candidatus Beckwithiibacteriota TaxID=1752726 RepID=A0A2H0DZS8_9BACT|nr:MAG: histidine--tRNA ligase [Candidatus Beckwithbacteria bacterium CG22_combo_CG10-13_8_21_14_all_01_47_9]PJC66395.1 MAG: histidine--tRNA ligase [Candidatus Beckwithbacteria bacterium CG_4_9_14_0_2_um_filter_47_11]
MSTKIKPQTLKGFRDFLPAEKRKRDYVTQKIKKTFELFGFEPLETPTLEYSEVILGKYGKEADKMVYSFKDKGGRNLSLRYDQTVPTARVLAQYQNSLPKCFRRYQIQNVFRADKPQKGRYREFTQCDIDIFGSTSPIADAEIIACTYFAFKNIGYPKIILRINDRQTLFSSLKSFSTKTADVLSIIQTIDKLDKKDKLSVLQELIKKGLSSKNANAALAAVAGAALTPNLKQIIEQSKLLGVPNQAIEFTPNLARGLDYYTGMIFEVILPEYPLGSFGGGGRYDNLINKLSGYNIPAVGIAFGFDRMVEAADELNLIPKENTGAKVLVTIFEDPQPALAAAAVLRQKNINAEVFPAQDKIDKQLKYANRKGVNFVLMIGPDEAAKNVVTLKNMQTGKQETITLAQATDVLAR